MARKKKTEIIDFTPSKYQEEIFKYIGGNGGHLVVEAAAGSGKTWTMVKSINFIPKDKKILMVAFNKDIVEELKKKTKGIENVEVKTLHGLGLTMLKRNYPGSSLIPEPFKYESHIKSNLSRYSSINLRSLDTKTYYQYVLNIKKYVDFGRFYLCQTEKDLDFIEDRYGIDTIADEKEVALNVMDWGKSELDTVDYTDMIWMPHVLFAKPMGLLYDFIMIDECQDMNKAERELVLKCFKMGTRLASFGDKNQCLYSFSGADPNSFEALKSIPNTTCLPLSISYRCSKNIVDFAKQIVPSIEANDDGREGEILRDVQLSDVEDGDMILCRNNAPLIKVYNEFLKIGKKAFIRGKEIGNNLKSCVKSTRKEELNPDCLKDGVFVRLYDDLFTTRNKIMERCGVDAKTAMTSPIIENKIDMIMALEVLSGGINTAEELIAKIDEIFPKRDKKSGISLSTIHKAKGLEANNVYIVCESLMPSKAAKKDWEIRQEYNLMYVAYTRAKNKLGFVDEDEFKKFDTSNDLSQNRLKSIETLVNKVLGKSTKVIINEQTANSIIERAKKIEFKPAAKKTVKISSGRKYNAFADVIKNKKKIKVKKT